MQKRARGGKKRKKKYLLRRILLCILVLGVLLASLMTLLGIFRIKEVELKGLARTPTKPVNSVVEMAEGKNYLFARKGKMKKALLKIPYVKNVRISYGFPSTLVIKFEEEKPIGQIFTKKSYILVNEELKVLEKTKTFDPGLPRITGVQTKGIKPGDSLFSSKTSQNKKRFFQELFSSEIINEIASIDLMEQGLQMYSKDDIKIVLRSFQDGQYKLKQLEKIYPEILKSRETFATILLDQSDHPIAVKKSGLEEKKVKGEGGGGQESNDKKEKNKGEKPQNEEKMPEKDEKVQ